MSSNADQTPGMDIQDVITAMCLWEAHLEIYDEAGTNPICQFRSDLGANQTREALAELAPACNALWHELNGWEKWDTLDWHFCPDFILEITMQDGELVAPKTLEPST
ncbi:hypothetical protein [Kiloniella sp.]|uniref:hypothetical protein n=1 Tax=Kiloniella sp. TaxID=1938587 RepID=UPI003B02CC37